MKILTPLSNLKEVEPLIAAGADELYFGLSLVKHTDDTNCLNFRPIDDANFRSLPEAKKAISIAQKNKKPIFLCLNTRLFSQQRYLYDLIKQLKGLSGIIATDITLIKNIRKFFPELKIITSIRSGIFNSHAVDFFRLHGADKITMPLRLPFKETLEMIENNACDFEIFVRNECCHHISGHCHYTHNIWDGLCDSEDQTKPVCKNKTAAFFTGRTKTRKKDLSQLTKHHNLFHHGHCGICFVRFLSKEAANRTNIKIDGRLLILKRKMRELEFIRKALRYLQKSVETDIVKKIKEAHLDVFKTDCKNDCSYKY